MRAWESDSVSRTGRVGIGNDGVNVYGQCMGIVGISVWKSV